MPIKNTDFWDAKSCHLVTLYRSFGETCRFHFQGRRFLFTMIMETARSSATSLNFSQIKLRYVIQDSILLSWLSLWLCFNQNSPPNTSLTEKTLICYVLPSACRNQKEYCFGGRFTGFFPFLLDNSLTKVEM